MKGKAVKLVQGDPRKREIETGALELAKKFSIYPEINLIDLDSAFGTGDNTNLIRQICKICNCNVGGGIRTIGKAYEILKSGAGKIIIGTKADREFLLRLPKEKTIVAVDSRKGLVVKGGWKNSTNETPIQKAKELEKYCSGFLYTYVDKEGTMESIDLQTIKELRKITDKKIMYAGGISDRSQILELDQYNADSVIGMAYYKNKIKIEDCFASLLNFEKNNGLIPTIVNDEYGQVLMLAFSSKESVMEALKTKKGVYYSRTRKKLWVKGEISGNYQELLRVNIDCDNDTLLFTVRQKNNACHTGSYSCFGDKEFTFSTLQNIVKSKKGKRSYTGKLFEDDQLLKEKILEEVKEVINFTDIRNLRWELADLLYFLIVFMEKNNIEFKEIEKELEIRYSMKKYIKTTKLSE